MIPLRLKNHLLCAAAGVMLAWGAHATIDTYEFKSEQQEQQYRELTEQLRCPKCQNNSIADSNAIIASDMRLKVYELMQEGKDKQQVIDYMVARYGNFVTYEPPLTPATLILWLGPLLFVLVGGVVILMRTRQRKADSTTTDFSEQEQKRLQSLLKDDNRTDL